jgi:hypothetical protein
MSNNELQLAWEFVNHTNRNIFLTGKAGTGKTTFLHRIKSESMKRNVVVAPTGVAAINARGVTIHSFFQMPFGPILPQEAGVEINREFKRKFNKKKIDIIRSMDLLIIDEISMVRADLLDGIDQVLRKYKNKDKVFGGTQVLMIGDLQQLAPVVKQNEWELLKKYYETPYFFSSKAFQEAQPVNIELKHIYRQEDEKFIRILNEIRENKLTEESAKILNKRYHPGFEPPEGEDYILLTTHNYIADRINREKLDKINEKTYYFDAYLEGYFPENAYPNDKRLALKKGAQVMFIKNDSSFDKRYYNGKIGIITRIDQKNIYVKCPGDEMEIEVNRETWDNVSYEINPETQALEEVTKGTFSQIPLRLSWAITIHKSQGLTFDKAIIDAGLSFAHGQTYVALSRCKSLDGLILKSPVNKNSIINDKRVTGFNKNVALNQPGKEMLQRSKKNFFLESVAEIIHYYPFLYPVNRLIDIYYKNSSSIEGAFIDRLKHIKEQGIIPLLKIKESFLRQLSQMANNIDNPENDTLIQDRIKKALEYFSNQHNEHILKHFNEISYDIDNKKIKKDFEKHFLDLDRLIAVKTYIYQHINLPFRLNDYLNVRAKAHLVESKKKKKKINFDKLTEHTDLLEALRDLRMELAYSEDVHAFQIFTQQTLYELLEQLPTTPKQLKKINGIGKVRLKKYGDEILEIITAYCIANNIEIKEDEPEIKEVKKNTREISLEMFQAGLTTEEIALKRSLTTGTINNHLSTFFSTGEIDITDLVDKEKYLEIKQIIANNTFDNLTELKKIAGDKYSFDELRLIQKYLAVKNQQ